MAAALGVMTGCSDTPAPAGADPSIAAESAPATAAPPATARTPPKTAPTTPPPGGQDPAAAARPSGSGEIRLSIPSIRVRGLRVVAYTGTADDPAGDRIQDTGRLASPRGPRGGIGPGQVGNFIVTGHRTEAGRPLGRLPEVRNGAHVLVTSGGLVYDYVVTDTLSVSFREPASRAAQSAPVPGRPGVAATKPMITLSTCATPEDHAAGNYWKDALGNPEHRIDKIGVLVAVRPA
jgi:sortase A